jgi:chromosomal replication initiator protein
MRLGKLNAFRKQFRDCDVLLLDDLHFLAKKHATQEEFLHTFDVLHAAGRQVAATCDCHPRLNELLMPELVDRLLGGGVWGIVPPDFETRVNLLRVKGLKLGRSALPDDVIQFLAAHLRGNVRELEGAVNGLFHFSKVSGRGIDIPLAREALRELLRYSIRVVQLPDIDRVIRDFLNLEAGALQTANRAWAHSHPRMIAMYLARKYTSASYSEIGRYFGNRTHGTVGSAEKKVHGWIKDDTALTLGNQQTRVRDLVERIERDLLA